MIRDAFPAFFFPDRVFDWFENIWQQRGTSKPKFGDRSFRFNSTPIPRMAKRIGNLILELAAANESICLFIRLVKFISASNLARIEMNCLKRVNE